MLPDLYHENTGLDELDVDEESASAGFEIPEGDVRTLRRTMIRLAQLDRETDRVKATKAAVVASYDEALRKIDRDRRFLRSSLQAYVERHGQVKLPDVGTAFLQTGEPKVEVSDPDAFRDALADLFVRPVFDEAAARRYALERAVESGELVDGTTLVPGGPQLRLRKA